MAFTTHPNILRLTHDKGWKWTIFPETLSVYKFDTVFLFKLFIFLNGYLTLLRIQLIGCELRLSENNIFILYLTINQTSKKPKRIKTWRLISWKLFKKFQNTTQRAKIIDSRLFFPKSWQAPQLALIKLKLLKKWLSSKFLPNSRKLPTALWWTKRRKLSLINYIELLHETRKKTSYVKYYKEKNQIKKDPKVFSSLLHKKIIKENLTWTQWRSITHKKLSLNQLRFFLNYKKKLCVARNNLKKIRNLLKKKVKNTVLDKKKRINTSILRIEPSKNIVMNLKKLIKKNPNKFINFYLIFLEKLNSFQTFKKININPWLFLLTKNPKKIQKLIKNNLRLKLNRSKIRSYLRPKETVRQHLKKNRSIVKLLQHSIWKKIPIKEIQQECKTRSWCLWYLNKAILKKKKTKKNKLIFIYNDNYNKLINYDNDFNKNEQLKTKQKNWWKYKLHYRRTYKDELKLIAKYHYKYWLKKVLLKFFKINLRIKIFQPISELKNRKYVRRLYPIKFWMIKNKHRRSDCKRELQVKKNEKPSYYYKIRKKLTKNNQQNRYTQKKNTKKKSRAKYLSSYGVTGVSNLYKEARDKIIQNFWPSQFKRNKVNMKQFLPTAILFNKYLNPQLLANYIAYELEKTKKHKNVIKALNIGLRTLTYRKLTGYLICIRGRINASRRTRSLYLIYQDRPKKTLRQRVNFGSTQSRARIGSFSINVWVFFN